MTELWRGRSKSYPTKDEATGGGGNPAPFFFLEVKMDRPFLHTALPEAQGGGVEHAFTRWAREEANEKKQRKLPDPISALLGADYWRTGVVLRDPSSRRWFRFQRVYPQPDLRVAMHPRERRTTAAELAGREAACTASGLRFVSFMSGANLDPKELLKAAGRI